MAVAVQINAADLTVKVAEAAPPKELAESIRKLLVGKAVQLVNNDQPVFEFWFNSQTPLTAKPDSELKPFASLKEGTLLGAVAVHGDLRDYRDDELREGAYTLRFGLQPQDGNHLGTAEFPFFALLVPAKVDTKPDTMTTYKSLVKASSADTTSDHPRILSLRPVTGTEAGDLPKLNNPLPDHKTVRLRLPAVAGEAKTSIVLELVYEGRGHK